MKAKRQTKSLINLSENMILKNSELDKIRGGGWVLERYVEDGEVKYRYIYK